jgi:hypothetical protein
MSYQDDWNLVIDAFGGMNGKGWIRANCPFCEQKEGTPDRRQSMGLNTETGGYNCFKCKTTGIIPEDLRDEIPYMPPSEAATEVEKKIVQPCYGYMPLFEEPGLSSPDLDIVRDYVTRKGGFPKGRELTVEACAAARLGAILHGYYGQRIVMPIPDYQWQNLWEMPWRGWQARDYTGAPANGKNHLYCMGLDRIGLLYNEPALWHETSEPCFGVESILDTLALWPDSVAVLGKPLESQISKFVAARRPVVICLDGDAWEEGLMYALKLRFLGQRAGAVRLPPKTDPGEVPRADLNRAARASLISWNAVAL